MHVSIIDRVTYVLCVGRTYMICFKEVPILNVKYSANIVLCICNIRCVCPHSALFRNQCTVRYI
jgi:hypothetical protein